jgi:hypothetical protein
MRRCIAPGLYALEPLLVPTPWLIAAAVLGWIDGDAARGTVGSALGLLLGLRIALDLWVARCLRGCWPGWRTVVAVPLRDVLILGVWCVSWMTRTVTWRGHRLRIGADSRLSRPPSEALGPAN